MFYFTAICAIQPEVLICITLQGQPQRNDRGGEMPTSRRCVQTQELYTRLRSGSVKQLVIFPLAFFLALSAGWRKEGEASWLIFPHSPDPNIQTSPWHSHLTHTHTYTHSAGRNTDTQTHTWLFTVSDCRVNKGGKGSGIRQKGSQVKQGDWRYHSELDGRWRKWNFVGVEPDFKL